MKHCKGHVTNDMLHISIDFYSDDENVMAVTRTTNKGLELVNMLVGDEALEVYKKLIGEINYENFRND